MSGTSTCVCDSTEIEVVPTSKTFTHTWKIVNLKRLFDVATTSKWIYIPAGDHEEPQIWNINIFIDPDVKSDITFDIGFRNDVAKVEFDFFQHSIYIVEKNTIDRKIQCHDKETKLSGYYTIEIDKKVLDEENVKKQAGELTLKCEIIFSKDELVYNNRKSCDIDSCIKKANFVKFESMYNEKFSDVKIVIGDKEFRVHKVILAAESPVFAAMFEHDMKENIENFVEIADVDREIMQEMLNFIYTGKVNNIAAVASDLLVAANKYQLGELKLMCEETLTNDLNVENVNALLTLAEKYGAETLKANALKFFKVHAKEIVRSENFETDFECLLHLLPGMVKSVILTE